MKNYRLGLLLIICCLTIACESKTKKSNNISNQSEKKECANKLQPRIEIDSNLIKLYSNGSIAPSDVFLDPKDKGHNITNWLGKYVVLDFWASWCSPCLEDQPFIKELRKEFTNENVEFISISIEDSYDAWKEDVVKYNLVENEYWIGDKRNSPLYSLTYSIVGGENEKSTVVSLPTYILIDPKGLIIERGLMRPSKPEFSNMLKEKLSESK